MCEYRFRVEMIFIESSKKWEKMFEAVFAKHIN